MLVLTRKLGESILIEGGIEITVLDIKGAGRNAQVRLGIAAPRAVSVLRKEICDEVTQENRRAALAARRGLQAWQGLLQTTEQTTGGDDVEGWRTEADLEGEQGGDGGTGAVR